MDSSPKQQIIERVKQANNILVTVSNDPSVDQLASCIGLTLMLNAMGKHATAVFSGRIPSTLEFLQPEKTLESNTDSLRDFIISLDKSKADKLRYKVEDQVVRIFITPYRTKISDADLIFSQGDFNVEVVIALGVKEREHIDSAITAHGRILHDATVISVNASDDGATDVGSINWNEPSASSLCEMIVSISEAFGSGLIDNQMATAFLTGIVAQTERFSNSKTTPKVMTMSAQLMAAGANQQLIANKLSEEYTAPVRMAQNADSDYQEAVDVITIDHDENQINISETGEFIKAQPAEEQAEQYNEPEPEPPKPVDEPEQAESNLPPVAEDLTKEPDYSDEELPEIHKEGRSVLPERLPTGDNQVTSSSGQTENSYALQTEHKVIKPLKHDEQSSNEKVESKISTQRKVLDADDDPTKQNPFTANAQPPHEGDHVSPLDPTQDIGILNHDKPGSDTSQIDEADKMLEDIKKELQSAEPDVQPELAEPPKETNVPENHEETARQAVDDVLKNAPYDANRPKPVESLNAQPAFDQLHNPPEVKPDTSASQNSEPEPAFKMPELAIEPLTNLPDTLVSSEPTKLTPPEPADASALAPTADEPVPAVSVAPDGTLKVDSSQQQPTSPKTNNDMAPPAPPPVPPPIFPPAN